MGKRKVPELKTDAAAGAFLEQDLSDLDFAQFRPIRFEFERKTAQLNMRLPAGLLEAVKQRAAARGMPYTGSSGKRSRRRWPHRIRCGRAWPPYASVASSRRGTPSQPRVGGSRDFLAATGGRSESVP